MGGELIPHPQVSPLPWHPLQQVPILGVPPLPGGGAGRRWHPGRDRDQEGASPQGQRPHHTEHLCAGFMGEFLGQWKTRPNSSNCETLPRTLPGPWGDSAQSWGPPRWGCLLRTLPLTPAPPALPAQAGSHEEGWRPPCPHFGASTCSAPGRACPLAPAGRWTGIAA